MTLKVVDRSKLITGGRELVCERLSKEGTLEMAEYI